MNWNELHHEINELQKDVLATTKEISSLNHCERMANMIKEAKTLITANEKLHRSLQEEIDKRKILHNMIEDMKGRIRVYARIRPLSYSFS